MIKFQRKKSSILILLGLIIIIVLIFVGKTKMNLPTRDVLAVVDGVSITQKDFDRSMARVPEAYKAEYAKDPENFLDELIVVELLYQEAKQKGVAKALTSSSNGEQEKEAAISELLAEVARQVVVTEPEMQKFYDTHKDEVGDSSYEMISPKIAKYLSQQKEEQVLASYVEGLRNKATIVKNEQWLTSQQAGKTSSPLQQALASGKPTVLDLGAGTCVPCRMMKPIFTELEVEFKDKANIILLEIADHQDLARKYRVRVIPTQVFFDKEGKEYWRHEGFMPKEEIIKKMQEKGVN